MRTVCAQHLNGRITKKAKNSFQMTSAKSLNAKPSFPLLAEVSATTVWKHKGGIRPLLGTPEPRACDLLKSLTTPDSLLATALATYGSPGPTQKSTGDDGKLNTLTVSAGPFNLWKHREECCSRSIIWYIKPSKSTGLHLFFTHTHKLQRFHTTDHSLG